jgi:hypothetical protein
MKKTNKTKMIWMAGAAICAIALGQDTENRVTMPFPNPNRPRVLVVNQIQGSITVRGYNGNDAIIEGSHLGERTRDSSRYPGMHRIDQPGGMDITQDENTITIHGDVMHSSNITVQVPMQTSLKLKTVNGGKISVENVSGEVEADNTNGSVMITNVSGSVVASSTNGKVTVTLDKVTPNKSMSFSSLNGTVDVTLPADTKANLRMRTDNGEIWSDFDVKLDGGSHAQVDQGRSGRRIRIDKTVYGSINGGGPEIQMVSFNGTIYLRKK